MEPKDGNRSLAGTIGIVVVIVLLVLTNGVTIWWLTSKKQAPEAPTNQNVGAVVYPDAPILPLPTTSVPVVDLEKTELDNATGGVTIAWMPQPVEQKITDLFTVEQLNAIAAAEYGNPDQLAAANFNDVISDAKVSLVGKVSSGPHTGASLAVFTYVPQGPHFRPMFYRLLISSQGKPIVLAKHSDQVYGGWLQLMRVNTEIVIENINLPQTIAIPTTQFGTGQLQRGATDPLMRFTIIQELRFLFSANGVDVFRDAVRNCFVVKAPDGSAQFYYLDTDFITAPTAASGMTPTPVSFVPQFTWRDGKQNSNAYVSAFYGGCGGFGCYNYVKNYNEFYTGHIPDAMQPVGTTPNGRTVYALVNSSYIATADAGETPLLQFMYDSYYPGTGPNGDFLPKKSFTDFINDRPLLYWQDPLGDWMELRRAEYIPAAECGKPVIYLYPTEPTDVSVQVAPAGGFTETIPEYPADGWKVHARPSGDLLNYADNTHYSSLFWEGFALEYERPSEGFVVSRAEVPTFLRSTLARLGLNAVETQEFMDFWAPRMEADPYYFVTFLPQVQFDQLAPLTVTPSPDTVIRVFMDYQGLQEPIRVKQPTIITPERRGFTVVEWGGALHR